MKTISVNEISLAYERRGKGNPLLLIHGFPLDHTIWRKTADLLESDFDLILPDLRGFGESTTNSDSFSMKDLASDLAGLLDDLKIQKAALAGHSMGGYVALAFAREYPARVAGLALVASQAAADTEERKKGRYKTAEETAEKGVGVVADSMAPQFSSDRALQNYARELVLKQGSRGVIGALKAMAEREEMTPFLSTFDFPILLIHGDADALIPVERAREIKSLLPRADLVEIPKAGHLPMIEAAERTAEALRKLK